METSLKGLCEDSPRPADTGWRRDDLAVVGVATTTGSGRRGERYPPPMIGAAGSPQVSGVIEVAETADMDDGLSVSEGPRVLDVCGYSALLWT
jgi:hypothetical protein